MNRLAIAAADVQTGSEFRHTGQVELGERIAFFRAELTSILVDPSYAFTVIEDAEQPDRVVQVALDENGRHGVIEATNAYGGAGMIDEHPDVAERLRALGFDTETCECFPAIPVALDPAEAAAKIEDAFVALGAQANFTPQTHANSLEGQRLEDKRGGPPAGEASSMVSTDVAGASASAPVIDSRLSAPRVLLVLVAVVSLAALLAYITFM